MFDARGFINDHFGGVRALHESLADAPDRPKLDTIYKWTVRGTMSRDRLVMLLNNLERRDGKPVSLLPYCGGQACACSNGKLSDTGEQPGIFD